MAGIAAGAAGFGAGSTSGGGGGGGNRGGSSRRRVLLLFSVLVIIQLACWRGTRRLRTVGGEASEEGYSSSFALDEGGLMPGIESSWRARPVSSPWKRRSVMNEPWQAAEGRQAVSDASPDDMKLGKDEGESEKKNKKHSSSSFSSSSSNSKEKKHSSTLSHTSSASSSSEKSTKTTATTTDNSSPTSTPIRCQPLPLSKSPDEVCEHVREHCPSTGHLDYLEFYYCIGLDASSAAQSGISSSKPTPAPQSLRSLTVSHRKSQGIDEQGESRKEEFKTTKGQKQQQPLPTHLVLLRAAALTAIILWMLFLFSWVGVVASDFFCPNLGTIAARLGMSESTAGVTFLAFGNGSPDVFSTFGAMRTGSGSLAIGELIGAASFIVSVISGSMMLIAPFRVKRYPFLRDVGFFTVAVALTMSFLIDGKLRFSECLGLVGLYFAYATTVIVGSWWQQRRRRQRLLLAAARSEYDSRLSSPGGSHSGGGHLTESGDENGGVHSRSMADVEARSPYLTLPTETSLSSATTRGRPVSPSEYDPDVDPLDLWAAQASQHHNGSHSNLSSQRTSPLASPHVRGERPTTASSADSANAAAAISQQQRLLGAGHRFRPGAIARHSLLGAVEFRDVVRSLQQEALADRSVEVFQSRDPERFLHHRHHALAAAAVAGASPSQPGAPASAGGSGGGGGAHKRHGRNKSLVEARPPLSAVESVGSNLMRDRSVSMGPHSVEGKPAIRRAASTAIGGVATGAMATATKMQNQAQDTRPSAFDARAVSAAVDDPWREHAQGDGCDGTDLLPPPAMSLESQQASEGKPDLPRLVIGDDTAGSTAQPGALARLSAGSSASVPVLKRDRSRSRSRDRSSLGQQSRTDFKHLLKVLFPSLRHFSKKSWLGIAVGVVTAPAILILNLTLPVVDDDAERAAIEGHQSILSGESPSGRIRLEGQESDLVARQPHLGSAAIGHGHDEGHEENIIDLSNEGSNERRERGTSAASAAGSNPWKSAEDDEEDDVDHLRVADALHGLARESSPDLLSSRPESSPLLSRRQREHEASAAAANGQVVDDDNDDAASMESWASDDSHLDNSQSSHLFVVLAQCVLAPPFCVWSITTSAKSSGVGWKVSVALLVGLSLALLVLLALQRLRSHGSVLSSQAVATVGWARVAMGFLVSILYIMTIVDEVVSILQTLGVILGLSDAILGLTIFAMGNSLGDLVANVTIARMGHPIMAISACFAGPLLNLLLGIGLSGTYLLSGSSSTGAHLASSSSSSSWFRSLGAFSKMPTPGVDGGVYHIDFSPTLFVSGLGLLVILTGTLIAVPLNNFYLNRTLGATLIVTYVVIMVINVGVELWSLRHQ